MKCLVLIENWLYQCRCAYLLCSCVYLTLKWIASIIAKMNHSSPATPAQHHKHLCTANISPVVLQQHIKIGRVKIGRGALTVLLNCNLQYKILYIKPSLFPVNKMFIVTRKVIVFFSFIINFNCLLQYNFLSFTSSLWI